MLAAVVPNGDLRDTSKTRGSQELRYVETLYSYDSAGHLTSVTDPNGNVTTYVVDDFGQTISTTSPVTGTTTATFDLAGNLLTRTNAASAVETRSYDLLGRLTSRNWTGGPSSAWSYDSTTDGNLGKGRATESFSDSVTETLFYDRRGSCFRTR